MVYYDLILGPRPPYISLPSSRIRLLDQVMIQRRTQVCSLGETRRVGFTSTLSELLRRYLIELTYCAVSERIQSSRSLVILTAFFTRYFVQITTYQN